MVSQIISDNPFAPTGDQYGELLETKENSSGYFELYGKNIFVLKNKAKEMTMDDARTNVAIVEKFYKRNHSKLIYFNDGREVLNVQKGVGGYWFNNTKSFFKKTVVLYKKGDAMSAVMDIILQLANVLPWVEPNLVLTSEIDKAIKEAKKTVNFGPANKLYNQLKKNKDPESFKTDLLIIWAMARGGVRHGWDFVSEELAKEGIILTAKSCGTRFDRNVYKFLKTEEAAACLGFCREMHWNGLDVPFDYFDPSEQTELLKIAEKDVEKRASDKKI